MSRKSDCNDYPDSNDGTDSADSRDCWDRAGYRNHADSTDPLIELKSRERAWRTFVLPHPGDLRDRRELGDLRDHQAGAVNDRADPSAVRRRLQPAVRERRVPDTQRLALVTNEVRVLFHSECCPNSDPPLSPVGGSPDRAALHSELGGIPHFKEVHHETSVAPTA